jgi:protein-S-isoprenylcysteine O-methyltransferase Ste14
MIIRWTAIISLKKAFTVKVSILKDHKLKQDGIYKWIRHPSYTGMFIYGFGYGLVFHSFLCILLVLFAVWFSTHSRILVEEEVLESHFGESYRKYKNKSWKLFPGIY